MNISYRSEIVPEYQNALMHASNRKALQRVIAEYAQVAPDALRAARTMTITDFRVWRKGLKQERQGHSAGQAWLARFGAILLPALMLKASLVADHYKVPWGCAYLRLRELDQLHDARKSDAPPRYRRR